MSGRNRGPPPHTMKGVPTAGYLPPVHDPAFARGVPQMPHPSLLEEMRESQFGRGPGPTPLSHHHAIIEERLSVQHQEIQGLLIDNQSLAATHVALKQELELAQHELQRMAHFAGSLQAEKDVHMMELYEKSHRMENDLRGLEAMKAELHHVHAEVNELSAARQDLSVQVQAMSQELARTNADLQQKPALKVDIENMKQEIQRARAAIEYEKKGYTKHFEHGKEMEKNLISMARELEKLRAEIANGEKRARTAAAVGNPGYSGHYSNPEAGYAGNSYPVYGMNHVPAGPEGYPQYAPGHGSWSAYDMQRTQGQR